MVKRESSRQNLRVMANTFQERRLSQVLDSQPDSPLPSRRSHTHSAHQVRDRADTRAVPTVGPGVRRRAEFIREDVGNHPDSPSCSRYYQLPRPDHQPSFIGLSSLVLVGCFLLGGQVKTEHGVWCDSLHHHVCHHPGRFVRFVFAASLGKNMYSKVEVSVLRYHSPTTKCF